MTLQRFQFSRFQFKIKIVRFFKAQMKNRVVRLSKLKQSTTVLIIKCIGFESKKIMLSDLVFNQNKVIIYLSKKTSRLEEVVIKASFGNDIFKTISDLDIQLRPINNSQEVLRIVPGLFTGQHAGGGKAEQLFLRGFDLDHGTDINITVDGIPVNIASHAHGQGYADLHFVIPEFIDKVNFNKGPYFAGKGNFTTAGFVDFKTKNYLENNFVKIEDGQYNTFRGIVGLNLLNVNVNTRGNSLYLAGESSFTDGYFDSSQNFSRHNVMLKYHETKVGNNTLTAAATGFTSKWTASGQIPNRAVESGLVGWYGAIDTTEGGQTSRYNISTELLTKFKDRATVRNQLYYSKYDFELYSNFTFFKVDALNGDQIRQKENRNIIGYNSIYQNEYYIGTYKTETKAGIQTRYDNVNNIELSRTKNRNIITDRLTLGDVNEFNSAAYYSQKLVLNDKLDVTGAVRFDYFINNYNDKLMFHTVNTSATIVCPKLNFNYRLNDKLQLYLYNGKGFHSNDTRVVVQQNGKKVLPPAYGSDFGGFFKIGKNLVIQSAVLFLWLDQEFVYVGDEGVVEAGG